MLVENGVNKACLVEKMPVETGGGEGSSKNFTAFL